VKNLKNILEIIDDSPVLDKNMLALTKELSDYYCCAWGEAIETALPESLRQGKVINKGPQDELNKPNRASEVILLHDLDGNARWEFYIKHLKDALDKRQASIVVLPDKKSVLKAREIIQAKLACALGVLYRKQPKELEEWLKVKNGEVDIVIGTRSSIFAPLNNLGLIIINEEQDNTYKQDQVPHYHAREVAFMRIHIQKARLILGSSSPSLESFYLARENKIKYIFIPRNKNC
jgi:primosomal protein N' (replication factor Y)